MPPSQKGKQGTKGSKQIVEENIATLSFYRNMIIGSTVIYFSLMAVHSDGYSFSEVVRDLILHVLIWVLYVQRDFTA